MEIFLISVSIVLVSGIMALFSKRRLSGIVAVSGLVTAAAICLVPLLTTVIKWTEFSTSLDFPMSYGAFIVKLDPLSALFILPMLLLVTLCGVYGIGYLEHHAGKKHLGLCWFFYNLLVASMMLVLTAANGILFIMAWELMTVAAFVLVVFEHEKKSVRTAGWIYLTAGHVGVLFILSIFILLSIRNNSFNFADFALPPTSYPIASIIFVMSIIGFGMKAGIVPFHVWLPEADPAAPNHVAAIMSGIMIKLGVYGIFRCLTFLGPAEAWWGIMLVMIGAVSAFAGVTFALAQHDLKKLLAYSSVENIGVIFMGAGIGLIGISTISQNAQNAQIIAAAGFSGAILHMMNHSVFKGLLFLCAGSVQHGCGTLDLDKMGGLLKRMPWTGSAMVIGSASISGLPPFNGFVSEFLIYFACFYALVSLKGLFMFPMILTIIALALSGSIAMACFTKVSGTALLGEPRTEHAAHARESGMSMIIPVFILVLLCPLAAVSAPFITSSFIPVISRICSLSTSQSLQAISFYKGALWYISFISAGFAALTVFVMLLRSFLPRSDIQKRAGTWACGYEKTTGKMQYTPSSFVQPLTNFMYAILRSVRNDKRPHGIFPTESHYGTETPDIFQKFIYAPLFILIKNVAVWMHHFQSGRVQIYILYITITLLMLLIWKLT